MPDGSGCTGTPTIIALGINTEGQTLALGRWERSTENVMVTATLLSDLVDEGVHVPARRHQWIESA